MKLFAAVLISAGLLSAQLGQGRAAGGVVFANPSGYGNVAFPGTGRPSVPTSFGRQAPIRNGIGGVGGGAGVGGHRRNNGVGYAYPIFAGGYEGSYSDQSGYAGQQQPNVTIINNPAPAPVVPSVVINQYMAAPPEAAPEETTHIFQSPSRYPTEPASQEPTAPAPHYFLIAYKDHSVYSALAYWVEDKTMHYVTPQQTHNQASLDLIDIDFTKKLNQR